MSIASTSNSSYNDNQNVNRERQPSFYNQCYLSPIYDSDCIQVEYLRNIILNESEKLYNQKVEELMSQTIYEAPVCENKKITDEKQSAKSATCDQLLPS